jgi:hypothetical protein
MTQKLSFDRLRDAPAWVQNYYRILLDVELRGARSEGFQRLFDRVMHTIHGRDYRDTRALGSLGDQGCDGYLQAERTVFACYGPSPYFRIKEAAIKLRSDIKKAATNLDVPGFMQNWVFVFNYPGTHPVLIKEAMEASNTYGLPCEVWSRTDLEEEFLSEACGRSLAANFGPVPQDAKPAGRAYVVPESTRLPQRYMQAAFQLLRKRLQCDQKGYSNALTKWSKLVALDPFDALIAQNQLLLGSMAAMAMAGYLDPEKVAVAPLLHEAELSKAAWKQGGQRAWNLMMVTLHSVDDYIERKDDDYAPDVDPIGEDIDKLLVTIACGNRLALGLIRLYSRKSGKFETDCLDEAWEYIVKIPFFDSDQEHEDHIALVQRTGLLDTI